MKNDSLPKHYRAPEKVVIGSNTLENVNIIMSFNGFVPLLIGDGDIPHVWLNIPANNEGTEWYPLVKDNFSTNSKVLVKETKTSLKISTPDGVVLECKKKEDGSIVVLLLNLNPFGLKVESDANQLSIMNQTFQKNGFKNVGTMFGIGNA